MSTHHPSPEELQLSAIATLIEEGRPDEAEHGARKLLQAGDEKVLIDAHSLLGKALFVQENFDEAIPHFALAAQKRGYRDDWFSLMLSAARSRQFDLARDAFQGAVSAQSGDDGLTTGWVHYYYVRALCDAASFDRALICIETLTHRYSQAANTDPDFLRQQGLPSFEDLLDAIEAVACGLGATFDYRAWIDGFAGGLDERGRRALLALAETIGDELR
jgi:tetratricopeptide (TPR) repeat protein